MYRPARCLILSLLVLAGCETTPRRVSNETPPDWQMGQDTRRAAALTAPKQTPPTPPPPVASNPPPAVVRSALPAVTPVARPAVEMVWVSLNRWAALNGFGPARKVSSPPLAAYAFPTTNGAFTLQIGSLSAYWDRMEFRLGFPPRFNDDQVWVHNLDLKKNIEPLVRGLNPTSNNYRVIVIDPGHGGTNLGTRSAADGRLEKEYTLDWALRLVPLLEQAGWQVWLTRTNDIDVSLQDRIAYADLRRADLFVSLHFNSPGDSGSGREAAGLETYCVTPMSMTSTLKREYPDEITQFYPNNAFDEQNIQLAARLHRAVLTVNGDADRGVRRARFLTVLRGQRRPAVLIEGGYLSNQREARRMSDPAYRQSLAEAVAKGLNGLVVRPAPAPLVSAPAPLVDYRKSDNRLKPDDSPVKADTNSAVADAATTNALRLMSTKPPARLYSPRNAP